MKASLKVVAKLVQPAALVALSAMCASAFAADSDRTRVQIAGGRTIIDVDRARPLAEAVMALIDWSAQPISYEDPRYAYEADLEDITERVRKDLAKYPPGQPPKVIAPRGGKLSVSSASNDVAAILDQLVQAENSSGRGARFRVERREEFLHVVPTDARDRDGNWAPHPSVLDVPISLEAKDRTDYEMVEAICNAVTAAGDVQILLGIGLWGGISSTSGPQRYRLGAESEPARDVLIRALKTLAPDRTLLTWVLFYEPGHSRYWLSLLPLSQEPPPVRTPERSPSPAGADSDPFSVPVDGG